MQDVMAGEWRAKFEAAPTPAAPSAVTDEDRKPSYHRAPSADKPGILGAFSLDERAFFLRMECSFMDDVVVFFIVFGVSLSFSASWGSNGNRVMRSVYP